MTVVNNFGPAARSALRAISHRPVKIIGFVSLYVTIRRGVSPGDPIAEREAAAGLLAPGRGSPAPARRPAAREPDAVQRAAMIASAKAMARTLLDTFIISDGRGSKIAVGDIRLGRLEHLLEPLGKAAWTTGREYGLVWLLLHDRVTTSRPMARTLASAT